MGRNWVPKYKVKCSCGWRGVRAATHKPCPRCGFWCPRKVEERAVIAEKPTVQIQIQQKQIQDLESKRINELEAENKVLKQRIKRLEQHIAGGPCKLQFPKEGD